MSVCPSPLFLIMQTNAHCHLKGDWSSGSLLIRFCYCKSVLSYTLIVSLKNDSERNASFVKIETFVIEVKVTIFAFLWSEN